MWVNGVRSHQVVTPLSNRFLGTEPVCGKLPVSGRNRSLPNRDTSSSAVVSHHPVVIYSLSVSVNSDRLTILTRRLRPNFLKPPQSLRRRRVRAGVDEIMRFWSSAAFLRNFGSSSGCKFLDRVLTISVCRGRLSFSRAPYFPKSNASNFANQSTAVFFRCRIRSAASISSVLPH